MESFACSFKVPQGGDGKKRAGTNLGPDQLGWLIYIKWHVLHMPCS